MDTFILRDHLVRKRSPGQTDFVDTDQDAKLGEIAARRAPGLDQLDSAVKQISWGYTEV